MFSLISYLVEPKLMKKILGFVDKHIFSIAFASEGTTVQFTTMAPPAFCFKVVRETLVIEKTLVQTLIPISNKNGPV